MRFPLCVHLRDPYHCPKFRIVHPSCCRSRLSPLPSPRLLPRSLSMLYFTCFFAGPLSLFLDDILLFEGFRMICRMSRPLQWMWKNSCFGGWGYLRTGLHISRERILRFTSFFLRHVLPIRLHGHLSFHGVPSGRCPTRRRCLFHFLSSFPSAWSSCFWVDWVQSKYQGPLGCREGVSLPVELFFFYWFYFVVNLTIF